MKRRNTLNLWFQLTMPLLVCTVPTSVPHHCLLLDTFLPFRREWETSIFMVSISDYVSINLALLAVWLRVPQRQRTVHKVDITAIAILCSHESAMIYITFRIACWNTWNTSWPLGQVHTYSDLDLQKMPLCCGAIIVHTVRLNHTKSTQGKFLHCNSPNHML